MTYKSNRKRLFNSTKLPRLELKQKEGETLNYY